MVTSTWCWMMRAISGVFVFAALLPAADSQTLVKGIQAFHEGRFSEARQQLTQAVRETPGNASAKTFLALTQAATGQCQDAEAALQEQFRNGSGDLMRLAGLALVQCRLAGNQTSDIGPLMAKLQAAYPADPDVLYLAARWHMRAWNDVSQTLFEKVPASYRVNQVSAEVFETQGRYSDAVAEYRKAIAKNGRALNLHYRLGRALLLQSHDPAALAEAKKEFAAELALNVEDAAAEYQIGQIAGVQGDRAEAARHFTRARELRPDFPEALTASAKLLSDEKNYAAAIPLLEKAIALQPRNESARYSLMLAYRNAGQMEKARSQKQELDKLQKPPEGEFTEFLKKLGEKPQP